MSRSSRSLHPTMPALVEAIADYESLLMELKDRRERAGSLREMAELSRALEEETQVLARLRWRARTRTKGGDEAHRA